MIMNKCQAIRTTSEDRRSKLTLRFSFLLICFSLSWLAIPQTQAAPRHVYLTWQGDTSTTITVNYQTMEETGASEVYYDTKPRDGKIADSLAAPGLDIARMRRQVGAAAAWGVCKMGEVVAGDGSHESTVKLSCDSGTLSVSASLDPNTRRLTSLELAPTRDQRCVP
jgi:hypothetical protein